MSDDIILMSQSLISRFDIYCTCEAENLRMFRRGILYVGLMCLGIFFIRSITQIPTGGGYSIYHQSHGTDWFTIHNPSTGSTVRMSLRYHPPPQARTFHMGRQLRVPRDTARHIAHTLQKTMTLTATTVTKHVFVTAASEDHYGESIDAVAGAQHYFHKHKIILYDLGMTGRQVQHVKTWCGVEYRVFNFTNYPPHVKTLKKYSWKALIIMEVISQYGAALWFDSSTRFHSYDLKSLYKTAISSSGIAFVKVAPHSNFAVTHRKTFEFMTTDVERQKKVQQLSSGVVLYYHTDTMFHNVLWWWVLCALDPYCHAPIPWTACDFQTYNRFKEYAACHRYDQSVLNILTSNLHGYDHEKYLATDIEVTFERKTTSHHRIQATCTPSEPKVAVAPEPELKHFPVQDLNAPAQVIDSN